MPSVLYDLVERINGRWMFRQWRGETVYSKAISATFNRRSAFLNLFHINPKNLRIWQSGVNYLDKLNKYFLIEDPAEIEKAEATLKKALVLGLLKDSLSGSILSNTKINIESIGLKELSIK